MRRNESWMHFMDRAKANGVSPSRQEDIDREEDQNKITDKDRLDFLQSILKEKVICRNSTRGRGFRLHQTKSKNYNSVDSVREAIDSYMKIYPIEKDVFVQIRK